MKGKTTKIAPNPNSESNIIRNLAIGLINSLNNRLVAFDQSHRYVMEWSKGTGYIDNGYEKTKHYYKLEVYIKEDNGDIIPIYGDNHPIPSGHSQLRVLEAEIQAYKNLFLHGLGALISVQHSTFLQAEAAERNRELKASDEAKGKDTSNLIY